MSFHPRHWLGISKSSIDPAEVGTRAKSTKNHSMYNVSHPHPLMAARKRQLTICLDQ